MSATGDSYAAKPAGRFRLMFFRACAILGIACMLFYMMTLTYENARVSSDQTFVWNMSELSDEDDVRRTAVKLPKMTRQRKLVLLWTDYFSSRGNWLPSTEKLQCAVSDCDTTTNRSLLTKSSAVVIHWRDVDTNNLPHCTPSDTVQCPVWTLFNKEAPPHTSRSTLEPLEGKVHWTVTYRKDSDIYAPYGKVLKRLKPKQTNLGFDPSRRLVCWLVSNCKTASKREDFVTELKKYIDVDVYGKCGRLKCPHALAIDCYRWLSKRCKFYLSLENSNCKDYTTEKLYNAMAVGMVPIVMGNDSNYSHLPRRSYINVNDFPGPKELAGYLVAVGSSKDLYLSHSWWRLRYESKDYSYRWYCDLCEKLHGTSVHLVKLRPNLVSWWFNNSCWS